MNAFLIVLTPMILAAVVAAWLMIRDSLKAKDDDDDNDSALGI